MTAVVSVFPITLHESRPDPYYANCQTSKSKTSVINFKSHQAHMIRMFVRVQLIATYTPFTRWSWLDELALRAGSTSARRALVERTSCARRPGLMSLMCAWCVLDERSSSARRASSSS